MDRAVAGLPEGGGLQDPLFETVVERVPPLAEHEGRANLERPGFTAQRNVTQKYPAVVLRLDSAVEWIVRRKR